MSKSTARASGRKAVVRPRKPYSDFPLSPHASGKWQKKILGKIHYFGRWARVVNGHLERVDGDGWKEALELYKSQADDLHAGRTPRVQNLDGLTVAGLCNQFLTAKLRKRDSGEMGSRMFVEYKEITDLLVATFGPRRLVEDLAADDFEQLRDVMAKRWGPVRLGNAVTRVKSVFRYGIEKGLIEKSVRYGGEFKKPDKSVLRRHKAKNGGRMLEAEQVRGLLEALERNPQLRAMTLLGLNCGFGNNDVATLPLSAVDLDADMIDYPRPKTGIGRRCPLWPETVAALRSVIKARPATDSKLVFINSRGSPWVKVTDRSRTDNISVHFTEAMKAVGFHREGLGFYSLRHVFRTVADEARDPVAIDIIMGHSDPSMGGHYRERVADERLVAVVNVVHSWLFAK
jgi:integrase